ncbi:hypothetical protein F2Q70_00005014 [Brassica cretica]|uniref:Uncharacterized protein n=1 Tax=Brassica cretica TaxID=69181 RepID=A0A8S9IK29_BRACR|nr:hypothetical protein F2Q70_00005014 [Brassica cretica]
MLYSFSLRTKFDEEIQGEEASEPDTYGKRRKETERTSSALPPTQGTESST